MLKREAKTDHSVVSGPTRSRRFGRALKLLLPAPRCGDCSWNCIYCKMRQLRSSSDLSLKQITAPLEMILQKKPKLDSLVISGTTDPTLHEFFPELVKEILDLRKEYGGEFKIHCITNGSELGVEPVWQACRKLDHLWIKLDCADEKLFQAANHPDHSVAREGTLARYLERIQTLGPICLHTTLWRFPDQSARQNWSAENLKGLLEIYKTLNPRSLHLTTLREKSLFSKMQPVSVADLEAFALRVEEELGIPVEVFG